MGVLEVQRAWKPHDSRQVVDVGVRSEFGAQALLQGRELVEGDVGTKIVVMPTSATFDDHAWCCIAFLDNCRGVLDLFLAVCIGKECAWAHNVFGASAGKIGRVDGDENAS